jgi:membrane-associated phospholipid phosphatase
MLNAFCFVSMRGNVVYLFHWHDFLSFYGMKRMVTSFVGLLLFIHNGIAQNDSLHVDSLKQRKHKSSIYDMRPKYQLPLAAAAIVGSSLAFKALDQRAYLSPSDALKLDPYEINAFDRPAALQDPTNFSKDASMGDFFLNFSVASPALLALDKKIRKDWVDLLTLYLAAQAFDNMLYFGAILAVRRPRPMAYNPALDSVARSGVGMTKSFFSGHVSFGATGTFFAVKVFTDYHHIKGMKRILLYTAAAVPPLITGYYRIKSGRHFKTDVIAGLIAGSTSGILVPELFKHRNKEKPVAFLPYYVPEGGGMTMTVKLNTKKKRANIEQGLSNVDRK